MNRKIRKRREFLTRKSQLIVSGPYQTATPFEAAKYCLREGVSLEWRARHLAPSVPVPQPIFDAIRKCGPEIQFFIRQRCA